MFRVMFVFVVLNLNFCCSMVGILRWISAVIFSVFVFSFFSTLTSYTMVLPARGGLKSSWTLPDPMVLTVASFLSYSIWAPSLGVIPLAASLRSGTSRTFSGSRFPKAFSGGISTVSVFLIFSLGRASSRAFSTQFSPTTTSCGS